MTSAHRALLQRLDEALDDLRRPHLSDEDIHRVRKDLKRARAALRLLRQCTGGPEYRRDNAAMRDAARPLRSIRDAAVLQQTLQHLWNGAHRKVEPFAGRLLRRLEQYPLTARRRLRPPVLRSCAAKLRPVRRRIAALAARDLETARPISGLKLTYKRSRKACARAHAERTNENLHEWRKQTQYFDNQLDITAPFGPPLFAKSRKRAHKVADHLGDDHDLVALELAIRRFVARNPAGAARASLEAGARALLDLLERRRKKLQRRAFHVGRHLYAAKPERYQP